MNRGNFLKGLFAAIIAPKTIIKAAESISKPEILASEIAYEYTDVTYVSQYIAGFSKMSKQLMENLPWLQSTLPSMLLKDFYKIDYE